MVTLGVGSTLGRWYEGHWFSRMPGLVGSLDKRGRTGSCYYGSLESEGNPVGTGGAQDNGRSRTAWGTQLPPTDLSWKRPIKVTCLRRIFIQYLYIKANDTYFMLRFCENAQFCQDKYRKL